MKLSLYIISIFLLFLLFKKDTSYGLKLKCFKCGQNVEEDQLICSNCDTVVRKICDTCFHTIDVNWRECPFCNSSIVKTNKKRR